MFSPVSWQHYIRSTQNNLQSDKNKTANAVKPILKLANECFRQYLGNITLNRLKITSKVLKIEQRMP